MSANSQGNPTVFLGSFGDSEPNSILDSVVKMLRDIKGKAEKALSKDPFDKLALEDLDVQGAKLLIKRLAASFPVNDRILNAQLARRLLKKDEVAIAILALLQMVFNKVAWGILSSEKDPLERQRLLMIIVRIRELAIGVGNDTYVLPKATKQSS